MIYETLGDRQKEYEKNSDYVLTRRLPIIIRVDGRSFSRLTRKLTKPYSVDIGNIMSETMMYCIMEMQGAVFGYQQHDEINFILRNDQSFDSDPWYQNRIQKITSVASSLATLSFNRGLSRLDPPLDIIGDAIFDARVFALPTISEVVNYLVWRQQDCIRDAVSAAAQEELSLKFGKRTAMKLLQKRTVAEKKELLLSQANIDFDEIYSSSFKYGVAAYKVPTIIPSKEGMTARNKWTLNDTVPLFVEEKDFIYNILLNGHDVFRAPNVFPLKDQQ